MPYWTGEKDQVRPVWQRLVLPPSGMDQWFTRVLVVMLVITLASSVLALTTALSLKDQITQSTHQRNAYQDQAQQRSCLVLDQIKKAPGSTLTDADLRAVGC